MRIASAFSVRASGPMITLRDSRARVLKRPPVKSIARARTITRSDQTGRIHR